MYVRCKLPRGGEVMVNPAYVSAIEGDEGGSVVHLSDGKCIPVDESFNSLFGKVKSVAKQGSSSSAVLLRPVKGGAA